ncbi:MAG: ribokinase [bacterium]|jgi:ribokinase
MGEEKKRITVIGSLVFDLVARTPKRPVKGETVIGSDFGMFPGGKGANQAVQAARLGAAVNMVGRVGNDFFGSALLRSLNESGVNTDHVLIDRDATTAVGCIVVDAEGDNSIVVVPQANMRCTKADVDKALPLLAVSDILLLQLEIPLAVVEYAARRAKEYGVRVLLNPAPAQPLSGDLLSFVDLITPNEKEMAMLAGRELQSKADYNAAAREILRSGLSAVIVTLGEKGALLVETDRSLTVPAWPVRAVDTTAAGDAFTGALAVALAEGQSIEMALRFAGAAGALAVGKSGAQPSLPDRREVVDYLKKRCG